MFFKIGDIVTIKGMKCEILDKEPAHKLYRVRNHHLCKTFIFSEDELFAQINTKFVDINDPGSDPVGVDFPRYIDIE